MAADRDTQEGRSESPSPFAVVDVGTNSIRMAVVQPDAGLDYTILSQHKEVVRLGEGEFATNRLTPAAMDRGLLVLSKFAEVARGAGASEISVFGTAALREAVNAAEFVERAAEEAGLHVSVISGAEEARLIYLGVLTGLELGSQRALVIDIGGGSTELAVGDAHGPHLLESLKLGAIRVAGIFTEGITGAVEPQLYRRIQNYARGVGVHSLQRVVDSGFDLAYGSSGTILNLCEIVLRQRGDLSPSGRDEPIRLEELESLGMKLASLTLEQRRRVPGINPERADIIVAGAAVLTSLLRAVGATQLHPSERALREGMISDRMQRLGGRHAASEGSVRRRSVLQLARRCHYEESHAQTVARLALSLFRQAGTLGLHRFGAPEAELLHFAAILHDIGGFISYSDHHRHGYYLVRHSPLLGFDATEIQILAAIVLHHRKGLPKRKEDAMADLGRRQREVVTVLSTLLRLAESMDRGHLTQVEEVALRTGSGRDLHLELISDQDCQLELWGLEHHQSAILEVFGRKLLPSVRKPDRPESTA